MIENKLILRISFDYLNGNENIFDLIKKIADKHKIDGILERKKDKVFITASSDLENIQKFADELGKLLPYSIFMGEASTEVVYELPMPLEKGFHIKGEINVLPQNLSPCPSCTKELLDEKNRRFYYPFISCSYCGNQYSYLYSYPFDRQNTVFKFFQMCPDCQKEYEDKNSFRYKYPLTSCHQCLTPIYLKKGENERYGFDSEKTIGAFNTAAGVIKKGNLLRVYTGNGEKVVGLITQENIEKVRQLLDIKRQLIKVMFTNFSKLTDYLVLSDKEIKALASQEKPILYVKPSQNFKEKNLVSGSLNILKAKLPDEPALLLLAYHLQNEGIDYVFIEDVKKEHQKNITDFELNADLPVINPQKDMKILVIDKYFLIKEGEKGVIPNIIKVKKTGNLSIAGEYATLDLGGEYLIDKKEKIINQLTDFVDEINQLCLLEGQEENIEIPYKEKKTFKDYQGAIYSVIAENNLFEEGVIGLYFSYTSKNNLVAVKTEKGILKPIIQIKPIPEFESISQTGKYILETIKNSSPEGEKLIKNFKEKFPQLYSKFENAALPETYKKTGNLIPVLNVAATLLEVFPYEDVSFTEEAVLYLQEEAINFKGKKGVRIDFVLEEIDDMFFLDWSKIIQSLISYKLAGAEKDMLAFSLFDELSNWIINQVATIYAKLKIDNIVLAGDFFVNPALTGKLIGSFSKYNLYINKKLPMDKQNIAFGGIFV